MSSPQLRFSCPREWESMAPSGEGRHCSACNQVVTDFSAMSNKEISAFLKDNWSENSCGHFHARQLDRPFNDWRDRLISLYQRMDTRSYRLLFMRTLLLGFAGALLFLAGCHHERLTGAYSSPEKHQLKKKS